MSFFKTVFFYDVTVHAVVCSSGTQETIADCFTKAEFSANAIAVSKMVMKWTMTTIMIMTMLLMRMIIMMMEDEEENCDMWSNLQVKLNISIPPSS
jgi:hypothetical protein